MLFIPTNQTPREQPPHTPTKLSYTKHNTTGIHFVAQVQARHTTGKTQEHTPHRGQNCRILLGSTTGFGVSALGENRMLQLLAQGPTATVSCMRRPVSCKLTYTGPQGLPQEIQKQGPAHNNEVLQAAAPEMPGCCI